MTSLFSHERQERRAGLLDFFEAVRLLSNVTAEDMSAREKEA
jgi:hypothetical protein